MNVPAPPAPYTDFANQYQKGTPGVLPTGRINVPQSNISPPNAGFSIPNQMQSGLNANQYTSQVRLLDVADNRAGNQKTNDVALSSTPWQTLQPYSLICIGGQDEYWMASKGVNPNDRPMMGCVIDYLMDNPRAPIQTYTAFERGVNPTATGGNILLTAEVDLAVVEATVDRIKKKGILMGSGLSQVKRFLQSFDENDVIDVTDQRLVYGNLLQDMGGDKKKWFQAFIPDSTVISTTLGDGDQILNELDQASGFGTFGTKVEGHAFVSQCTTKLKCRTMDTVYIVIRAKVDENGGVDKAKFTSPELCFLTSDQLKKAFRGTPGNDDDDKFDNMGGKLRSIMENTIGVTRENNGDYVVLGGWKLGRVVDVHAIPIGNRNGGFIKGQDIYEIMLNIEQCTPFEFMRHLM